MAKNLEVSSVTCSSALFRWSHEAENNIHDVHFKLFCAGTRQYVDLNGEIVQEKFKFHHSSHSTSKNTESYFTEQLAANTKYTCSISSLAGNIESPPSQHVSFTTLPGGKLAIRIKHNINPSSQT